MTDFPLISRDYNNISLLRNGRALACTCAHESRLRGRGDTVQADRPGNRYGQKARTREHNGHEPTMVGKHHFLAYVDTRFLYCADGAAGKRSAVAQPCAVCAEKCARALIWLFAPACSTKPEQFISRRGNVLPTSAGYCRRHGRKKLIEFWHAMRPRQHRTTVNRSPNGTKRIAAQAHTHTQSIIV